MKKLILTTVLSLSTISAFAHICEGTFKIQEGSHESCESELTIKEFSVKGQKNSKVLIGNSEFSDEEVATISDLLFSDYILAANFKYEQPKYSESSFRINGSMKANETQVESSYDLPDVRFSQKTRMLCQKDTLNITQEGWANLLIPVLSLIPQDEGSRKCNYKRI